MLTSPNDVKRHHVVSRTHITKPAVRPLGHPSLCKDKSSHLMFVKHFFRALIEAHCFAMISLKVWVKPNVAFLSLKLFGTLDGNLSEFS